MADFATAEKVLVTVKRLSLLQLNAYAHHHTCPKFLTAPVTDHATLRRKRATFRSLIEKPPCSSDMGQYA
jgi:hypothetical protein